MALKNGRTTIIWNHKIAIKCAAAKNKAVNCVYVFTYWCADVFKCLYEWNTFGWLKSSFLRYFWMCPCVWYKLKSCFDVALHVHLMIKTIQWHFIVCPKQLNINWNFRCIWISNAWNGVAFIVHVTSSKKRKLHFVKFIWANLINITHQYIHAIIVSIKKREKR